LTAPFFLCYTPHYWVIGEDPFDPSEGERRNKRSMPKPSSQILLWSEEHQGYDLHIHGQRQRSFYPQDEPAWLAWVQEQTAFAFQGQAGHLSVIKEARPGGSQYWYAYRRQARRTRKRYLGPSARVTFAHLEQTARELPHSSSPPSLSESAAGVQWSSDQPSSLLSAKLSNPRLPGWLVERVRLLRELDAVRSYPLTLISASAGSGKTILLSAWVAAQRAEEGRGRAPDAAKFQSIFAWLSLDAQDREPIGFWTSVIAALRSHLPLIGQTAMALLHSQEPPPFSAILTNLLHDLEQIEREVILILDDFHVISHQSIDQAMLFLLEHLPAHLHLVLATRSDPALPLSRFRIRGHLLEVRDQDLRFRQDETTRFLVQSMGLPLSEEEVAILQTRTEGWIAGLQLAALSLRKREDRSTFVKDFAGSHRYLLDYVQQDILTQLSAPLQEFLLKTAILPRMNAAICQAVTASPSLQASQQMLEQLERANLFVMPLDDERRWYRYHDLFREALHVRLQASSPELIPLLHQRAAGFYETQGELREAITHALAAADYSYAARLMERAAPILLLSGEAHTMYSWIVTLPESILWQSARLALTVMLRLLESLYSVTDAVYNKTQAQVEQTIARLEVMLRCREERASCSEGDETDTLVAFTSIRRRLRLLRAWIETRALLKGGEKERLSALAGELEEHGQDEEIGWNMIAYSITFWLVEGLQREGALLIPWLLEVKQQALKAGDWLVSIRVREWLAFASMRAGQWHAVERECLAGLALMEQSGGRTAWAGYLYYFLGCAYYSWNRLDEAADAARHLLRIAQDWQQVDLLMMGYSSLAQIETVCGNPTAADQALQQAEALSRQAPLAGQRFLLAGMRAHYWLAVGNLEAASRWADQVVFSRAAWDPNHKEVFLIWIRVSLAQQHVTRALELLEQFREHLDRPGNSNIVMDYLASYALALHQAGKREKVQAVMTRLLAMTEPEGSLRVYLDVGQPMKQVLQSLLIVPRETEEPTAVSASFSRSYVERLLAAFEQNASSAAQHRTRPDTSPLRIQESLSPQELRVLRLLGAGSTYAEIAQELIVSPNTIKTQVSNIYRKLGVSRRTEALETAHQLRWL
jgi:LuxR family maltose regulon positive regulatory protein